MNVFPDMASSLLSIGQLCDDGCIALFDKHQVAIIKDNAVILTGHRNPRTKLWMVDLNASPTLDPIVDPVPMGTRILVLLAFHGR